MYGIFFLDLSSLLDLLSSLQTVFTRNKKNWEAQSMNVTKLAVARV